MFCELLDVAVPLDASGQHVVVAEDKRWTRTYASVVDAELWITGESNRYERALDLCQRHTRELPDI